MDAAVAIVTRGDNASLRRLVDLIDQQRSGSDGEVVLLVVDNGPTRTVSPEGSPVDVVLHEPRRGIPFARNAAVGWVMGRVDAVAFIDDDERPGDRWLEALVESIDELGADVVVGPAVRVLPRTAPRWVRGYNLFRTPDLAHGDRVRSGATNNILLRTSVFESVRPWFDEKLSDVGGSDHEYLRRVSAAGLEIRWTVKAVVLEDVPAGRLTVRWLARRALRTGSVEARVSVHAGEPRVRIAGAAMIRLAANVVRVPLALVDVAWLGRCLFGACNAVGTMLGLLGRVVASYGDHDVPGADGNRRADDA